MKGVTLIDVLVGTALMLIVFVGIFGGFQLGLKVVEQSKNRITATAIASQELETIRNLSYESVGTNEENCHPCGILEQASSIVRNNVEYTIERRVEYIIDPVDGIEGPEDDCVNDYKRAETKVSWQTRFSGQVVLVTDIAPASLAQECAGTGGILLVSVFDAYGIMVLSPLIEIKDPQTQQTLGSVAPEGGVHYFPLTPAIYRVEVSKSGYSSERTYGIQEIATPEKPHSQVFEGQLSEISFSIDKVSSFSVDTLSPWGAGLFSDPFSDESKISEKFQVVISGDEVNLATSTEGYLSSGYLMSEAIAPGDLVSWEEFSWSDSEPANTDLKHRIYYNTGTEWVLIPDADLGGNSQGFDDSPLDLSPLDSDTYSQLKLKASFSSTATSSTPTLYDWQVSWVNTDATSIPEVTFHLQGEKINGTDGDEEPEPKYSQDHTSNAQGHIDITDLEWDSYTFSIDPATDLDLIDTNPSPQPIGLPPDTNILVKMYIRGETSLLVTVQDNLTLEPVFSASVGLYNSGLSYDKTRYTDEKGQTLFIPLDSATYNLEVQAAGYLDFSTTVVVSGDTTKVIGLEQVE